MDDSEKAKLIGKYRKAINRLILLDYDGTLVDYTSIPVRARLTNHLFDILKKLAYTPQTKLYIITGRSHKDIDEIFVNLPIDIIAEHGAMIRDKGIWKNQINNNSIWKEKILPVLNQITSKCPQSFVEEKPFSLAWHYRSTESQSGYIYSRELISILEKTIHSDKLKILDGNKVVEILSEEIGKGKAVKKIFEQFKNDFILSIGDDATDEEMFDYFSHIANAFTIKVGNGDTFARYKLDGINDVVSLLKLISV